MVTGFKSVLLQELVLELGNLRPRFPKKEDDFERGSVWNLGNLNLVL